MKLTYLCIFRPLLYKHPGGRDFESGYFKECLKKYKFNSDEGAKII